MRFDFIFFIPERDRDGAIYVDPIAPLDQVIERMESPRCVPDETLQGLVEDVLAISQRIATKGNYSLPEPQVQLLGERTLLGTLECHDIESAFGDLVQLAIDVDVGLAELTSAEVYLFGDDSNHISLDTTFHSLPWASPASLRSFVHRTNLANVWDWIPERDSQWAETGYLDEFLLLTRFPREDRFIQTYFDHPTGWWVIEAHEESTRYTTFIPDEDAVADIMLVWYESGLGPLFELASWRTTLGEARVTGRDGTGRFLSHPDLEDWEGDDDSDDDDGGTEVDPQIPTPLLLS